MTVLRYLMYRLVISRTLLWKKVRGISKGRRLFYAEKALREKME